MVEDNDFNRMFIASLLQSAGCVVTEAKSGEDAIAAFDKLSEHFDGVVMDINLPGINGVAATRVIRERFWSVPVVALTSGSQVSERECYEAGFNRYIQKPVTKGHLLETLRSAIDQHEHERDRDLPLTCLVVCENEEAQVFNSKVLKEIRENVSVMTSGTGAEAVELTTVVNFDVVLVDVDLPDMCGVDVAHEIQSNGGHTPKIVGISSSVIDGKTDGWSQFDGVLQTPLCATDLLPFFRSPGRSTKGIAKCGINAFGLILKSNKAMCRMFR